MRPLTCVVLLLTVLSLVTVSPTQQSPTTPVPNLITYSGKLVLSNGLDAPAKVVGVTFAIYRQQDGGAPIWLETQNVMPDSAGHYSVLLGSTRSQGIPTDLFSTQEQRWLGVQMQGQAEQPRVLLVSVPYAMKAADAETIGGLPASAFVLSMPSQSASSESSAGPTLSLNVPPLGGSGTTNYIPIWTNSTTLGNSMIYQTGGNVGIGNTHPAGTLDVSGGAFIRGTLQLPAIGTATATKGFNSQPLDALASAFNSGTHTAVNQHFRWQAEPAGNNTSSPSGKFNLLFASGNSVPSETGLSISGKGLITFATGQKFPGTGTITGVTAGTDLTGGGTSGNVTLNLDTTKVPQLHASNNFVGDQSVAGNLNVSGNVNASTIDSFPISSFAFQSQTNIFASQQQFNGNGGTMFVGDPGCVAGYAGIGFNALSGCNNYSMIGNGVETILNRPSGGGMHFREGNVEQVTIVSGGQVGIGTPTPSAMLEVDAPVEAALRGGQFVSSASNGQNGADGGDGVFAEGGGSASGFGGRGVFAQGGNSVSLVGGVGIYAVGGTGAGSGLAGYFAGDVHVSGNLSKTSGSFKIDHPLDPANKYLYHSFVESPDMMNIYNGNVVLDANGEAVVELPDWFGVLNRDFRYQLTCIGGFAPVYIAQKVQNNSFKIAGGQPRMEVSWQVTGIRQDAWANAHRIPVEVEKPERERGYYIHPELYGAPEEKSIEWARHPDLMKRMKERQAPSHPANKFVAPAQTLQASK